MDLVGYVLIVAGVATVVVALIWSFAVLLRENPVLAVLCLFLPMGLPVAMLLRGPRTWRPLAAWMVGLTLFFCGLAAFGPDR